MPTIIQGLSTTAPAGVELNRLDEAFRPVGWRWVETPEFQRIQPSITRDWTVSVHPDVSAFLTAERAKALPIETGGYLYGGWDFSLKQIVIVEASDLPPNSTATATKLTLGAAGCTALEKRLARRTRERLHVCGSWHSHPGSSAALSSADSAAMAKFRQIDQPNGTPTLLAVVADGGIEAHLEV
jgi:proteasome lid subunit RPN8/RPN11